MLQALVKKGNTVLVIEHNMDVVKVADYVVDLGPTGGQAGGYIVCEGTPEEVAAANTLTSKYILEELERDIQEASWEEEEGVNLDDLASNEEEPEEEPEELEENDEVVEEG